MEPRYGYRRKPRDESFRFSLTAQFRASDMQENPRCSRMDLTAALLSRGPMGAAPMGRRLDLGKASVRHVWRVQLVAVCWRKPREI